MTPFGVFTPVTRPFSTQIDTWGTLDISHAEAALDTLAIDTLGGDDTVDTSGLGPDVIGLDID